MNDQRDLFDRGEQQPRLPYQRGSQTSRDAARRAARSANDQHRRIMIWMDGRQDGTRTEMAEREPYGVGLPINVVTPRVHELVNRLKYLREATRLVTVDGRQGIKTEKRNGSAILILTEAGRGYLDRTRAGE